MKMKESKNSNALLVRIDLKSFVCNTHNEDTLLLRVEGPVEKLRLWWAGREVKPDWLRDYEHIK